MATQTSACPVQRHAADLDALFPGRYLSVTSFNRDGMGVATPLWFVSDGERLFALTDLHSAKVRRLRHNPRVLVAPCRASGKLRGEPLPARAEVLTEKHGLGARAGAPDRALQDLLPLRDVDLPAGAPSPRPEQRRRRCRACDHGRRTLMIPTLYEFAGGEPAFLALAAACWAEVTGGPPTCSESCGSQTRLRGTEIPAWGWDGLQDR